MTSIRLKLTLAAVALLGLFMSSLLFSNTLMLEWYYLQQTQGPFLRIYEEILAAGTTPRRITTELFRHLSADTGYKLVLADRAGGIRLSSSPEFRDGEPLSLPRDQKDYFLEHRRELQGGAVLYAALDKDPKGQSVVQLMASVGESEFLVITQPLRQLRANAAIAMRFFLLVGGAVLLLSAAAVALLSGRVIRPVTRITEIASSIARMNFRCATTAAGATRSGWLGKASTPSPRG